jgi:hypothetical protein
VDGSVGTASAIAAGAYHNCAIKAGSGAVVCWGLTSAGRATPPPSVDGTIGNRGLSMPDGSIVMTKNTCEIKRLRARKFVGRHVDPQRAIRSSACVIAQSSTGTTSALTKPVTVAVSHGHVESRDSASRSATRLVI